MSNFFFSCCAMPETSRHTTVAVMTVYMYTRILHAFCLRLVSPSLPPFLPPSLPPLSLSLSLHFLSLSQSLFFKQTGRPFFQSYCPFHTAYLEHTAHSFICRDSLCSDWAAQTQEFGNGHFWNLRTEKQLTSRILYQHRFTSAEHGLLLNTITNSTAKTTMPGVVLAKLTATSKDLRKVPSHLE